MMQHNIQSRIMHGVGAFIIALGTLVLIELGLNVWSSPKPVLGDAEVTTGLQIDKIGPTTVFAGDLVTYTIVVTNATASILNDVVITDTWNSQTFTGTYDYGGSVVVNSFVLTTTPVKYAQFNLAPLAANSSGMITVVMSISSALEPRWQSPAVGPTIVGNSVVITTSTPGVTASTDRVDTSIVGPLLVLTKNYTPTNPRIGRLLTYTFKLENKFRSDAVDATHVVITERLPNYAQFYAAYPPELSTYYPATNTVRWNLMQTLPVSGVAWVTLTVRISPTAPYGNIANSRTLCAAYADGIPSSIFCSQDVNTPNNDIFEKVGQTVSPPQQSGTISRTFPNRIMTYTISVYNPFTQAVTGLIVTDTLPTYNNVPTQTFQYLDLVSASPPALPTVISQSTRIVAWQLPNIQGWGLYTFTFQVLVPPQMRIDDNQTQRQYQNALSGNYAGVVLTTNDGGHDDSMKVLVVPQIQIFKIVTPTTQIYGLPVTYTLTLSNSGPTTIHDIRLTDLLPTSGQCSFVWDEFVSGLPPSSAGGNSVSWNSGITLTGYAQMTVAVFRATVFGALNATCFNTVQGYSPDTYIVKRTNLAPVVVDVPFRYNKTVSPSSVVLGDSIMYSVQQWNIGGVPATMNGFTDILPTGFYYQGNPLYTDFTGMPLVLQPYHANTYQTTFSVDVLGAPVACDSLPTTVSQAQGKFGMRIIDPPELATFWVNATSAAPVLVRPQAQAYKTATPSAVLTGDVVTFTVTLSNNTASTLNSIRLTDTLPSGFTYGGVLPGTPQQFAIQGSNVFWNDLSIPAGGKSTLAFTVTAPITVGNYTNQVKASSLTDALICIPKTTTPIAVQNGTVLINKSAAPTSIGPLGQFVYNLSLNNVGPYTVTVGRFTETLPGVPGYVWKYVSMQSGDPLPINTSPVVWSNLSIGPGKTQNLRFTARADTQVGTYPNLIYPVALAGMMTGTVPARWVITAVNNYNGSPVTIVPGVGIAKDVFPDEVNSGGTIVYTITVANESGGTISNLRLTDTLPSGFSFDSFVSGVLPVLTNPPVWTISSMPNHNREIMVFRAKVPALQPSGTYFNRVTATASNISIAPTGDTAPVIVHGVPNLYMSKSVDPTASVRARDVTYTLTLVNPDTADPVTARLTDTLPSGLVYSTMISGPTPVVTAPLVVWNNVVVPAGASVDLIFRAWIQPDAPDGLAYNQLAGSSGPYTFQSTGPSAPLLVVAAPTYDVQISKTDGSYTAAIGSGVVYTVHYTNTQNLLNLTASNVVITDTFSPSDYLAADAPGWNSVGPGVYTYSIGDLPANTTGFITIGLLIDNAIPADYHTITNTAEIGSDGAPGVPEATEQPTANNISTDIDTIRGPDLAIVNVSPLPSSVRQNAPITVVVTVQNLGVDVALGPDNQGWFGSDLYVKPAGDPAPINPGDRYLGLCPTIANYCPNDARPNQYATYNGSGLLPGGLTALTYTYQLTQSGTYWLYLQADTFSGQNGDPDPTMFGSSAHGRVFEGNEINNIYGPIQIYVQPNVYLPIVRKNS